MSNEKLKDVYENWLEHQEMDGCSCHINPPCSYCTHPGNIIDEFPVHNKWGGGPDKLIIHEGQLAVASGLGVCYVSYLYESGNIEDYEVEMD
jgi:hypothetical protein